MLALLFILEEEVEEVVEEDKVVFFLAAPFAFGGTKGGWPSWNVLLLVDGADGSLNDEKEDAEEEEKEEEEEEEEAEEEVFFPLDDFVEFKLVATLDLPVPRGNGVSSSMKSPPDSSKSSIESLFDPPGVR